MAAIDFTSRIERGDRAAVEGLAELGLWLEVNEARSAVQILGYCPETASENVVAHIPVTPAILRYWGDVTF